jgi:hypothetical protein
MLSMLVHVSIKHTDETECIFHHYSDICRYPFLLDNMCALRLPLSANIYSLIRFFTRRSAIIHMVEFLSVFFDALHPAPI